MYLYFSEPGSEGAESPSQIGGKSSLVLPSSPWCVMDDCSQAPVYWAMKALSAFPNLPLPTALNSDLEFLTCPVMATFQLFCAPLTKLEALCRAVGR